MDALDAVEKLDRVAIDILTGKNDNIIQWWCLWLSLYEGSVV